MYVCMYVSPDGDEHLMGVADGGGFSLNIEGQVANQRLMSRTDGTGSSFGPPLPGNHGNALRRSAALSSLIFSVACTMLAIPSGPIVGCLLSAYIDRSLLPVSRALLLVGCVVLFHAPPAETEPSTTGCNNILGSSAPAKSFCMWGHKCRRRCTGRKARCHASSCLHPSSCPQGK